MIVQVPGQRLGSKDSPPPNKNKTTWVPNRIFDAEAFRKPLDSLLDRSGMFLEPI